MPQVRLPPVLQPRAGGRERLQVEGRSVAEALRSLEQDHPGLRGWLLDERGRLREHVNVFLGERLVDLARPLEGEDELQVLQAISGGMEAPEEDTVELLVGTRKGLVVLRGERDGEVAESERHFPGQVVEYAMRDPRSGRCHAAVTHGQFGPHLYFTDDLSGEWTQVEGPAFPADAEASVKRIWVVEPGAEENVLWAGVAPAALFRSADGGLTWELDRGLWDQPSRPEWEGGLGGLCLHSICADPGDPGRLAVAISAVGVWLSEDGGESWRRGGRGLVPRYLPEEAREDTLMLCVHKMLRAPREPSTLYLQFHGGVYRSDDGGESWLDIGEGLPADFGFPIVLDPEDPATAYVIPLVSDQDRVTPEGKLRVYRTRNRGATWEPLSAGLPQENAWATVLRQAFCCDGGSPLGLYFGTESGEVYGSADGGDSWRLLAGHLPPVTSVRSG